MSLTDCYSFQELLESSNYIKSRIGIYNNKLSDLSNDIKILSDDINVLSDRLKIIESAKQYYLKVIDKIYMNSISEMESFVNYVLQYVFYDEKYRIKLDISNRYNKSITFYLIDDEKGLELPLRKGNGNGVKAVVSFILLTYYLIRMKCKYMFLDEAFVNISSAYITRFFGYIQELCHKYNMCIVLITHDQRFIDFADNIYEVRKGEVTKCK